MPGKRQENPIPIKQGGTLFLLILLCLGTFFVGLGAYPLYDPDEGRNAEVAREVVVDGHWLPPTINGEVRYQKPPLYYWLEAVSFKIWGIREFAARFPSALAAFLGVLITIVLGRRLWGEEKGWWAGIILATSFIYAIYARIVIFDMTLTLFITLAIALFWLGMVDEKKKVFHLSALFGALAFLTKGPIGVLIPAMAVGLPLIYRWRKGHRSAVPWISMILIFLVVSAPVYILAEIRSPGYCYKFFWEENVMRYLTPEFHRRGPWYYYLVVILVGLFPWTWLLKNLPRIWKELRYTHTQELLFLGSWILLPTLFFTISKSKLPHYTLPTFPAWALLLAYAIPWQIFSPKPLKAGMALVIFYLSAILLMGPYLAKSRTSANLLEGVYLDPQTPIVAFTKTSWYTLAFYSGRKIEVIYKKTPLKRVIKEKGALYLFIKKKELSYISDLAKEYGKSLKIISQANDHLLLLIKGEKGSLLNKGSMPPPKVSKGASGNNAR